MSILIENSVKRSFFGQSVHIAFLTPEFVSDYPDGGGLGNYLNRITKLLVEHGHSVELFLPSSLNPQVVNHNGVRVERVRGPWRVRHRVMERLLRPLPGTSLRRTELLFRATADQLADAMERRHCEQPFDIVQSADYLAVGLGVQKRPPRVHVIRCSSPIDLYHLADGRIDASAKLQEQLEFEALRRADRCYSPSRFTAEHYRRKLSRDFGVVRTPRSVEVPIAGELPFQLPPRFLIYFGQLTHRKGLDWLIDALAIAFDRDASLRLVIVGAAGAYEISEKFQGLLKHRDKIMLLYPLPKAQLMRVVMDAEAAIIPSIVDNLPNTAIESLTLGVPVIGTRGASIDELVEDGVNGRLVPVNDAVGLANAILETWQQRAPFKKGFEWSSPIADEMSDRVAVDSLLNFVRSSYHERS